MVGGYYSYTINSSLANTDDDGSTACGDSSRLRIQYREADEAAQPPAKACPKRVICKQRPVYPRIPDDEPVRSQLPGRSLIRFATHGRSRFT